MIEVSDETEIEETQEPWRPRLFPKQEEILLDKHKILLVCGPRFSGKSIGIAHSFIMCAWETWEANLAVVVSSYKVATGGGSWADVEIAAREWAEAGIESEYGVTFDIVSSDPTTGRPGSKLQKESRTPMLEIRNKFGNISTIRLISIDNENEIEEKTKSGRFQKIWLVELSNFKSRKIVTCFYPLLRTGLTHIHSNPDHVGYFAEDRYQLISDTNPAPDGKQSWIYQWFYEGNCEGVPAKDLPSVEAFKKKKAVLEIFIEDNIYLDSEKKSELIGLFAGDPVDYQRFVEGIWPDGTLDKAAMFGDVFTEQLIIEGQIEVSELTETLITGWDVGPVNKAFALLERRIESGKTMWMLLDEVVYVGNSIPLDEFVYEVMSKLMEINDFYKKLRPNFKGFKFDHWSDTSSWNLNGGDDTGTEAVEIYNLSNRQIELQPVEKAAKSVEVGCSIIRRLMREERFFTGSNCPQAKESFQKIKRSSKAGKTLDPGDKYKHILDSVRYAIFSWEMQEMAAGSIQPKIRDHRTITLPL